MIRCEWERCAESATHTVEIWFPDAEEERWAVCRAHDRLLKLQAVQSRPKAAPRAETAQSVAVHCGQCQRHLGEPPNLAFEERPPCGQCESTLRHVSISVADQATVHESVRVRVKTAGKGGWRLDARTGDDFTRDLDAWGRLDRTQDRVADVYREAIELYDSTRITSTARLRDHHD